MTNQANTQTTLPSYFDFIAKGLAYINRFRVVEPDEGDSYAAVTLNVLHGKSNKVRYSPVDCIVNGSEAKELLQKYQTEINSDTTKVFACICIGDMTSKLYKPSSGTYAGQPRPIIKARLLKVTNLSINGELVQSTVGTKDDNAGTEPQVLNQTSSKGRSEEVSEVEFEDPNWPLLASFEVSVKDQNYIAKLQRLGEIGYDARLSPNGVFCVAQSQQALAMLEKRRSNKSVV